MPTEPINFCAGAVIGAFVTVIESPVCTKEHGGGRATRNRHDGSDGKCYPRRNQPQIDEFNSRGQAFEAIKGVLCGRIDNLNEQMAYSLSFIPPTQQRLNKLEVATKNLAFNIDGFEGTTTSEQPALLPEPPAPPAAAQSLPQEREQEPEQKTQIPLCTCNRSFDSVAPSTVPMVRPTDTRASCSMGSGRQTSEHGFFDTTSSPTHARRTRTRHMARTFKEVGGGKATLAVALPPAALHGGGEGV